MTDGVRGTFHIAVTEEGAVFAISEQEPLFCFRCNTEEEAIEAATDTLTQYFQKYRGVNERPQVRRLAPLPMTHFTARHEYAAEVA